MSLRTCENLLCTGQKFCAFPLQCTLNAPKTTANVSTANIATRVKCSRVSHCNGTKDQCININNPESCIFYNAVEVVDRVTLARVPTDRDLVAKIEKADVLRAEDLNELVKRFKEYAKL